MKLLILTQKVDINDDVLGFMHGWIAEFAKHCDKLSVVCLQKGEYDLPANVKVLSLGKEKLLNCYIAKLLYCWQFYRYIWKYRKEYDSVFVHMNKEYVVLGGVAWRLLSKRIGLWYTHKQVSLSLKIAEKLADVIFTASKESFRLASEKVKVIGHGINTDIFKPSENREKNDKFRILTVGRISPIKDLKTLARAVACLKQKNISLDIVGAAGTVEQEEYFQEVRDLVAKKGIEDKINFIGSVPNREVLKYYQRADLFINMSLTGSLDKAVLEAMACELPIVSCNDAVIKDVLRSFKKELGFKKRSIKELAERIDNLSKLDINRRYSIGKELRNIVIKDHNLAALIIKIKKIYQTNGKTSF
ncbi:glycosyltransferase family 4 protein [Patescibacteria group bacterium]|nr:glycosyltransferase family 4 protein [Candidatus Falkowbacteria bacterium]MBU3906010.1 glycosyltransferase family 4 protein [Patescibacteria group bacterium]MCG2698460.1 glycosyltransferase family 4 protein [Candidatus Parcubacteria bacterium]MBU4015460.1 glycosyltransferase family 4 protein [Patescibacteria group bacterium]MBU4026299.1 glycosyltransferase family 4 protein [Patescibacteria group bacterium]